jgi:hypothetical protein
MGMPGRQASPLLRWAALGLLCAAWLRPQQLPFEPPHDFGQSITGAFEGWFPNADGSFSILLGYYNRNLKQELEIPAGPDNRIEPGGPDQGQPTHFLPGRQWGVFTIVAPKDFGGRKLTWTITVNGKSTTIPMSLNPLWELQPFREASGNEPPYIAFSENGPWVNGPAGQSTTVTMTMPEPADLTLWVADDASAPLAGARPKTPAALLFWSKFRGPGTVTFANPRPVAQDADFKAPPSAKFKGKAHTSATFSEPGEYILRVVANDWSGDGGRGFQCCWSNAQVKVLVKPARGGSH